MKRFMSIALMTVLISGAVTVHAETPPEEISFESKLFGVYAENDNTKARNRHIKIGTFDVEADAAAGLTYDDNIYATSSNEEADTVLTIQPTIKIKSAWSRHSADVSAFIKDSRYMSNNSEDTTAFGASVNGRLDIKRGTYLTGNLMAQRRFESRGAQNAITTATEPTQYARRGGALRVVHAPGRVKLSAGIKTEERIYEDGKTSAGTTINNADRNHVQTIATLRTGYDLKRGLEAYVQLNNVDTSYSAVDTGVSGKRSSHGHDVLVGMSSTLAGKMQGTAYIGLSERTYDAASLSDISKPAFGANILYRPNGLTSVNLDLKRSIEETTIANAAAYVNTALTGRIEHALRRSVLVGATATMAKNSYEGGTLNREDDLMTLGIDGRYAVGQNLTASIGYEITDRDSSQAGVDYTRGQFMTRLMGHF